jgi:hypothetical protein
MDAVLPTPGGAKSNQGEIETQPASAGTVPAGEAKSNQGEIETLFVRTWINLSKVKNKRRRLT